MARSFMVSRKSYERYEFHQLIKSQLPGVSYWYKHHRRTDEVQVFLFEKHGPYNIRIKKPHHLFCFSIYRGTEKLFDSNRLSSCRQFQPKQVKQ